VNRLRELSGPAFPALERPFGYSARPAQIPVTGFCTPAEARQAGHHSLTACLAGHGAWRKDADKLTHSRFSAHVIKLHDALRQGKIATKPAYASQRPHSRLRSRHRLVEAQKCQALQLFVVAGRIDAAHRRPSRCHVIADCGLMA
jgi:hypothetical protein